jgi:SAM-dependent methyltransferase
MAKYYYREHVIGYQRLRTEGKMAWAEVHGATGFDDFASRAFLEAALPRLSFGASASRALEYGCGTGPGACFLAQRGFQVDGIDIVPLAIQIGDKWYLPNRRHCTPQALNAELQAVGFDVCYQDGGNMICVLSESPEA